MTPVEAVLDEIRAAAADEHDKGARFEELMLHANHVGLFSEDLDPVSGEQLGNFPQTYSHVGLINAAFAISPLPLEVGDP